MLLVSMLNTYIQGQRMKLKNRSTVFCENLCLLKYLSFIMDSVYTFTLLDSSAPYNSLTTYKISALSRMYILGHNTDLNKVYDLVKKKTDQVSLVAVFDFEIHL